MKQTITSPKGFLAAGLAAGIKKSGKPDMALIYSEVPAVAAAVFTTNQVKAAPVLVSRELVKKGRAQAIITNAGNANCWTGEQGLADALEMAAFTAEQLDLANDLVLVASTGSIGHPLPLPKVKAGIKRAVKLLSRSGGEAAAKAILTTDLTVKQTAVKVGKVTVAGMAKGSGMIEPGLGTMLGYITTDAEVTAAELKTILRQAAAKTFNMISVDNCMSTNDTVFVLANGLAGRPDLQAFARAVEEVCRYLAMAIARDGEGASKLLTVNVTGAANEREAKIVVKALIGSYLLKCAVYGQDRNIGRIVQAVGQTKARVNWPKFKFNWSMGKKEHVINVDLGRGQGQGCATGWGCDLTEGYITINARYHT